MLCRGYPLEKKATPSAWLFFAHQATTIRNDKVIDLHQGSDERPLYNLPVGGR